jgi:hypothetical protein
MEAMGGKAMDYTKPKPASQHIIIIPINNTNVFPFPENFASLSSVLSYEQFPLATTMSKTLGAGFYSDIWGAMPFAIGRADSEKYLIYTVN